METETLRSILASPSETLSQEIKRWFDPASPAGQSKLLLAALALRNQNGGRLIIGFDLAAGTPDAANAPQHPLQLFSGDLVQGLVSRHASETFPIDVSLIEVDGAPYIIVEVPPGITAPVVTKSPLRESGRDLVAANQVYVRTLNSNGTVSTALAGSKDWQPLFQRCFENREADIGQFLRRHLRDANLPSLVRALRDLTDVGAQPANGAGHTEERLRGLLAEGAERFEAEVQQRQLQLPDVGYLDVACLIEGAPPPVRPLAEFLGIVMAANPSLTGWPLWLDSRRSAQASDQPYVTGGVYEALLVRLKGDMLGLRYLDFWRIDPIGRLFHRRALEEDFGQLEEAVQPFTVLDVRLPVYRVGEAVVVAKRVVSALGYDLETTQLHFGFRWTRLSGRRVTSVDRHFGRETLGAQPAHDPEVISTLVAPANSPDSSLNQQVLQAITPLFEAFGGYRPSESLVDRLLRSLLKQS